MGMSIRRLPKPPPGYTGSATTWCSLGDTERSLILVSLLRSARKAARQELARSVRQAARCAASCTVEDALPPACVSALAVALDKAG